MTKQPMHVTIDSYLYARLDRDRGPLNMSRYIEILLSVASELQGDQIRELVGAQARTLRAEARAPRGVAGTRGR